jgi:hypothetical protein
VENLQALTELTARAKYICQVGKSGKPHFISEAIALAWNGGGEENLLLRMKFKWAA